MEQPGTNLTDFHEISYLIISRNLVGKIQVSLKRDKLNKYVIRRRVYVYDNIWANYS